jgi:hypothetical protein
MPRICPASGTELRNADPTPGPTPAIAVTSVRLELVLDLDTEKLVAVPLADDAGRFRFRH